MSLQYVLGVGFVGCLVNLIVLGVLVVIHRDRRKDAKSPSIPSEDDLFKGRISAEEYFYQLYEFERSKEMR